MASVALTYSDQVAVITIDNPPVNACGQVVRQGIMDRLKEIRQSDARAVVLRCAGRTFVAGADIREFNQPPLEPHLPDVVDALEQFELPVVAAIHGSALGGGLELALGCHFRVAVESAKLGLPEVNLGLIPGAGGTQRLPRLVGVEPAVEMITSGKPVSAAKAGVLGLVDQVVSSELADSAIAFAAAADRSTSRNGAPAPIQSREYTDTWWKGQENQLRRRVRGQESPLAALASIRNVMNLPLRQGLAAERQIFMDLKSSTQSAALRHVFFAERSTTRSIDLKLAEAPIESVGVIGAGTMGTGIALSFANAGIPVTVIELSDDNLQAGMRRIHASLEKGVALGKLTSEQAEKRKALIDGAISYDALSEVDLVIEAVFEDLDVKRKVFEALESNCRRDAVLATNTSYLDINTIARTVSNPGRVVGMHFFSPADRMKLLEVVRAEHSDAAVLARTVKVGKRIGKIVVPVGVCFGFAANRSYTAYQGACQHLLLQGVTPSALDQALTDWGMAMGPCAVLDLSGLDIGYNARQQNPNPPDDPTWFAASDALVEAGLLGRKSGKGFYLYEDVEGRPENPDALALVAATGRRLNVRQREFSAEEIVSTVMQAVARECGAIVDEGIAAQASDMDVIWVNGYGFPRWRGGPVFAAS